MFIYYFYTIKIVNKQHKLNDIINIIDSHRKFDNLINVYPI